LCDVVIIGRGGGSLEELWAFNEEPLVAGGGSFSDSGDISRRSRDRLYALRFCRRSEGGHATAAAQLVAPDQEELLGMLVSLREKLTALVSGKVDGEFRAPGSVDPFGGVIFSDLFCAVKIDKRLGIW
jgi:exodeoxyribonuclease VII large subunit